MTTRIPNNSSEGVYYNLDDKYKGPFSLRISGTTKFIKKINLTYYGRFGGPGGEFVHTCDGWENPEALSFETMHRAIEAAKHAHRIEGFYVSIETNID